MFNRWVGCCVHCLWIGGQCCGPAYAGSQAAHHAKVCHPEKEGFVGYIRKIRVRKPGSPHIPMRMGAA